MMTVSCQVHCSASTTIAVRKSACSRSQDIHGPAQDQHYLHEPDSLLSFLLSAMAVLSVEVLDAFLS